MLSLSRRIKALLQKDPDCVPASFLLVRRLQAVRMRNSCIVCEVFPYFWLLVKCVLLQVGKIFFYDFVEYVFCTFELGFFTFFYAYYP
ncbi:hypothetical protein H671_5g13761 [Cricetulus griseus]|uniref:Uncharacterized protein n=1 Tax=Cricetulus griseus TaxID=10029 RepID=A0A061I6K1_CRIGR|nr:hypothetical protein H671_5g13761 [Cricetulus griseus]